MGVNIICDHCEKPITGVSTRSMLIEEDYDLGICLKLSTGRGSNISDGAVNVEEIPRYGYRIFCRECKKSYDEALGSYA